VLAWRVGYIIDFMNDSKENNTKEAILHWIPSNEGGRKTPPVPSAGDRYYAVVEFDGYPPVYGGSGWSLIVEFDQATYDIEHVKVRFLSDFGPNELMVHGARFRLREGSRIVAEGRII
jgi:hypothetical protein